MQLTIPYVLTIFLFLGAALMGVSGCAETNHVSPPQEVGAFFVAGKEAQYRALESSRSGSVDLSAYVAWRESNILPLSMSMS